MSAALALLGCFSAWQVWRHNPLYASRSPLWLCTKIVLMFGATGALIFIVSLLTADRSAPDQVAVLLFCMVICTLGLVFGIGAAATPRIARLQTRLPPTAPIVWLHRRGLTRWLRIALMYLAVCGLLAVAPDPTRFIAEVLIAVGVLLSAVMLPVGYVMARRMDRAVTTLELNPWLHWQYPAEVRTLWCRAQVQRMTLKPPAFILRRDWLKLLALCAALVVPCLILMTGTWIERAGWALFCCVLLGLFVELVASEDRRAPARLASRLKDAPADVWFGHDGLICDGHFYTWIDTGVSLTSARIDWRPPRSVRFVFADSDSGAYGAPEMGTVTQNVLIPPGVVKDELALLQHQLRSRCPAAEVKLL